MSMQLITCLVAVAMFFLFLWFFIRAAYLGDELAVTRTEAALSKNEIARLKRRLSLANSACDTLRGGMRVMQERNDRQDAIIRQYEAERAPVCNFCHFPEFKMPTGVCLEKN